MTKRIELFINLSGDPEGVSFTVYRDTKPGLSLESPVAAIVDEASVWQEALVMQEEALVQDTLNPFTWYTSRIYEENPAPQLFVNGSPIPISDVTIYPNSKQLQINQEYDMTNTTVTCTYSYLVSVLKDDYVTQDGVNYMGPVPNPLNAPIGYSQIYDWQNTGMTLAWILDTTPHTFYYALQAKDKDGYLSSLSSEQPISLTVDPATVSYVVEKGESQEGPWIKVDVTTGTTYEDPNPSPVGHIPLQMTGTVDSNLDVHLQLVNPWANWQSNLRPSWFYRVHVIDDEGQFGPSSPSVPFYTGINIMPVKYILRRKPDNGTPATVDGTDAITVMTWTAPMVDASQEYIEFIDDSVPPGVYSYTTYVIDQQGYIGQPYVLSVDNRSATGGTV